MNCLMLYAAANLLQSSYVVHNISMHRFQRIKKKLFDKHLFVALAIDEHECGHRRNNIKCEECSNYREFDAFLKVFFLL